MVHSQKTITFIEKASKKHGGKYCYDKVKYVNTRTKITIICKKHGEDFEQTPASHLSGKGCPKCGGTCPHTTESFIAEAIKIHGNAYSYKDVKYINNRTKIKITCTTHEEDFEQTPSSHLSGVGCPKCSGKCPYTTESFITEAIKKHGNIYSYDNVKYINNHTKIKITCITHEEYFEQTPNSHLRGKGCSKCGGNYPFFKRNYLKCAENRFSQQSFLWKKVALSFSGDFDNACPLVSGQEKKKLLKEKKIVNSTRNVSRDLV
jgi:predicted  nucleic acid-binding Zn-ribbon protein